MGKRPSRKLNKYGLTQQQENFCQLYIKYGIGRKAYLEAYEKSQKWQLSAVDCEASKMLNNPKVSQRIELLNQQKEVHLMQSTKLNHRKLLETALQMLEDTNNPTERQHAVSIIKLLFAKEGLTQPQQTNISVNVNTATQEVTQYLDL